MIQLTEKAIQQAKTIMTANHKQGQGLRLGIVGGGCSGLSYKMDFEEKPQESDRVLEFDGLKVFIDPKAYLYLNNLTIDYHSDMMSSGFTFQNPSAKSTCGCGTSFSV
ncbi:MAG TPA: iron-sulfur cluster assembly accessory protein [Deltaproteobacteria bacterium]|nr:iron-sulfur cluster assembly accessory protein [Deltaproteobacteria bacterium]